MSLTEIDQMDRNLYFDLLDLEEEKPEVPRGYIDQIL